MAGLGGFLGSAMRYAVSGAVQRLFPPSMFPYGTLSVNVIGCLVLGMLGGLAENHDMFTAGTRVFLFIGILGGFTTFSSVSYETMSMARDGQFFYGLSNIALQIVLGLGAVWVGYNLSNLK